MKFNYPAMQRRATRLIDRFSETTITVKRTTGSSMVDGEVVIGSSSTVDMVGVANPATASMINGTTIQAGDLFVTVTTDIQPMMSDVFSVDGKDFQVVAIQEFKPSKTNMAYRVQLRV